MRQLFVKISFMTYMIMDNKQVSYNFSTRFIFCTTCMTDGMAGRRSAIAVILFQLSGPLPPDANAAISLTAK